MVGLDRQQRRDLSSLALALQDLTDGQRGLALQEPVLAQPAVRVDL